MNLRYRLCSGYKTVEYYRVSGITSKKALIRKCVHPYIMLGGNLSNRKKYKIVT